MTTVTFRSSQNRIIGFTAEGHSDYAEEGSDIVCASISSVVAMTECTINDVLGIGAHVRVNQEDASISLTLPGGLNEETDNICQTILAGLLVYLQNLSEEYSENLAVRMEDEDDDE